ncbi:alanyl-tRNA editing protein [Bacillus horti]|uniref:Alanyl-tRNA synthetase n=1 Tax=Caldalkalibacillus horti TaxID=77523 RepID=A0ABT9VVS1_9BACI|nr:DHHA1 domain-containing protein [Bacillus horti]MDQ0165059.1 alanyl-tRNA synthetase [Bacillus horti]
MTKKLYYSDSYLKMWQAKVVQVIEKEYEILVRLDVTAFYPHGGGQPCDLGSIDGIPVLDVYSEGEHIWHKLERLPKDTEVTCTIDWERRFDHMQQHTGQHLLSALCLEGLNAQTISFHLGLDHVSIDVAKWPLKWEELMTLEREVNRQIYLNRSIHSYFVTEDEAKSLPLVKPPTVSGSVRIVEIEDIEYNACGGTHVSRTGEIGIIKMLKAEKHKEGTRIYFKCGYRALQDYNEGLQTLTTLAATFQAGREHILDRFAKWEEERKQLEAELISLQKRNRAYQAQELLNHSPGNVVAHVFADQSFKDIQQLAQEIASGHDVLVLFATTAENKLILLHNGTQQVACGKLFKEHLSTFNGKGGGSDKTAQAGFTSKEDMLKFFDFLGQFR